MEVSTNDLIKALRICSDQEDGHCSLCPYSHIENGCDKLESDAADLIEKLIGGKQQMSEKQKVFISGPISTRPETYKAEFAAAADLVESCGFIPLNPATLPLGMDQGDYMRITLAMLETSDMVLMLNGWEQSDGANLEAGYAEYIKKPCLDMEHFKSWYAPKPEPKPEPEPVIRPQRRVERLFGSQESWSRTAAPDPKQEQGRPEGWRGFLLVRCPECGDTRGFCTKAAVTSSICKKCGTKFQLGDMVPAHVNCKKCGSHFRYMTNIVNQEPFTFDCLNCNAPIDLQLNTRGTAVVTVGENTRGGGTDDYHFGNPPREWREMRDGR